jgi:hypothetical protein
MNLRDLAAAHHRLIVGDAANGFAREITLVTPDGTQVKVNGFWNDMMAEKLDPQTGSMVSVRSVFVRLTNKSLRDAGLSSLPRSVNDGDKRPWLVIYAGLNDNDPRPKKVSEVRIDRTFDAIDCYLEPYQG